MAPQGFNRHKCNTAILKPLDELEAAIALLEKDTGNPTLQNDVYIKARSLDTAREGVETVRLNVDEIYFISTALTAAQALLPQSSPAGQAVTGYLDSVVVATPMVSTITP